MEGPCSLRIHTGDLREGQYYTTVLATTHTTAREVIQNALEKLSIFEDSFFYNLYEGRTKEPEDKWTCLSEDDYPVECLARWKKDRGNPSGEMQFYLCRKPPSVLAMSSIVESLQYSDKEKEPVSDLCLLNDLSEQSMLTALRTRFDEYNDIYTYVGSFLIAINPYFLFPMYNPKYTNMYQGKRLGELPPHIFAIADDAYNSMLNDCVDQTVIISGESGSGKTESTKFLLHHMMSLSSKLDDSSSLELITLGTGPVLEAFGNAKTKSNDNSSRFGKFILVSFRENGAYYEASIEKYLLEKSRIISQAPGERNYHVFYYLLAGADSELKSSLSLGQPTDYFYLGQGIYVPLEGVEEVKMFGTLVQSLGMLGFSPSTQLSMFTLLAAILHLGNVTFKKTDNEDAVTITNLDSVKTVSSLLKVEESTLCSTLTTRRSQAGGDWFVTSYKPEEAVATRDAMAKALYGALFDWIVDQVNYSLAAKGKKRYTTNKGNCIGVLDIFGFEVFQRNSFEQFCINYANEQLHQYFNKHVFKSEQEEYLSEGIKWSSVGYTDNCDCLELIAGKPVGLLALLDEECSFPGADDTTLFTKFQRQHKGHSHYQAPQRKLDDPIFTIVHYAGPVVYHIHGFREKNRDLMRQDIVDLLKTSRMDIVRALIGLPSLASSKWRCLKLMVLAAHAFQQCGKELANRKIAKEAKTDKLDAIAERHRKPTDPLSRNARKSLQRNRISSEITMPVVDITNDGESSSMPTSSSMTEQMFAELQVMPASEWAPIGNSYTISSGQASKWNIKKIDGEDIYSTDDKRKLSSFSNVYKRAKTVRNRNQVPFEPPLMMKDPKNFLSAPRVKSQSAKAKKKRNLRTFGSSSKPRKGPAPTVSAQFHASLSSLMERLEQTHPYFVRCIKSNSNKAPKVFDSDLVLKQLRYTGMLETIRIRKAGYSVRVPFDEFYEKYEVLMGKKQLDLGLQIGRFLDGLGFSKDDIQIGHNKVFMRDSQKYVLQNKLHDEVLSRIVTIQQWVRAKLMRCHYLQIVKSTMTIQAYVRGWFARKVAIYLRIRVCSAVIIQAQWRCYSQQQRYLLMKRATIIIQSCWRGSVQRRRYLELLEEQRRRVEEQRRLEELRRQEEERRLEELRREEERRRLEEEREQKRLEEERRLAEERKLKEEEERRLKKVEEERRLKEVEDKRRFEEQRRLEEERRNEEKRRLLEEERMNELIRQEEDRKQRETDDTKQKKMENTMATRNTLTNQKRTSELTSSRQSAMNWSKDLPEDDDFEALMKGLTESLDDLEQLAEEGHKIYDTLTQDKLKKRPPLHNSMIETSRKKSIPKDSPVNGEEVVKKKHRSLEHQSSESVVSVKERQKKLISQSNINQQHRPLQRARANSQTVMALEQASSVKKILAAMNSSSDLPREASPAKESSPTKETTPQKPNLRLKRSSPVLSTKLSSPFPSTRRMESINKTVPLTDTHSSIRKQQSADATASIEILCTPSKEPCSSDDELLSSDTKLNRKRSTLSKRLSTSADNVLDIQENVSQPPSPLMGRKRKATRSKSSENLSLFPGRGISFRRSGRRKNHISNESSKSPPHDGNKLISLAQGILTNLRIPGFSRQQSGSEPPLRSSWCLKVYDGTNDLENYVTARNASAAGEAEESSANDEQVASSEDAASSAMGSPHVFKAMNIARLAGCVVCKKPFSGFLSSGVRCQVCDIKCHRMCAARAKPCIVRIDTAKVVNEKIITNIEDVDKLGRFLLGKIRLLGEGDGEAERLFRMALQEFHTNLISQYSLAVQETFEAFLESLSGTKGTTLTFDILVGNFTNIMKGVVGDKPNSSSLVQIGVNQFKCFLDEFIKSRNQQDLIKKLADVKPKKLKKKKNIPAPPTVRHHRGHKLEAKQFNVLTVCEACDQRIPVLGHGMVCKVCGYTCHEECHKNIKKCLGQRRPASSDITRSQAATAVFGQELSALVPPNTIKVPLVLERCLNHIEVKGLFVQGIYRKPPSAKNKKMLKEALEQDPQGTDLDSYDMHCITSMVTAFLGQLPNSLISPFLYKDFIRAASITSVPEKLETLHHLLDQLSDLNHTVFERIIFHLARVAQQEDTNLMSPNNLAIIFAPILLKPPYKQLPQELLQDLPKQTNCIDCIITEQVEKLKVTLHEIKYLTSAAHDTASLIENMMEQNKLPEDNGIVNGGHVDTGLVQTRKKDPTTDDKAAAASKKLRRLTIKLGEIERERAEWTARLSTFEHLEENNDASVANETAELFNGSKEQGDSSSSDTEDDSKHDELSDDSILSDDAILSERARLPTLRLSSLKHLNKERPKMITKRKPTRPKRESHDYENL